MEFNKSSRFNIENKKEENQTNIPEDLLSQLDNIINQKSKKPNLIHYKGKIGEFYYDPNIWEISCNHLRFKNRKVESLPKNLELPEGCIDISEMFSWCENLTDISPLENWNTSNVESMLSMFHYCENLTDISPLKNWNTSSVSNMSHMFHNCKSLTDISPLENWDTSNVTNMSEMFEYCENI